MRPAVVACGFGLLVGQIVVLAIVCVGIGAVTELALYRYLVGQLDVAVHDASDRSVRIFSRTPPPMPWRHHQRTVSRRPGPGPVFLDAPAQPVGMVARRGHQGWGDRRRILDHRRRPRRVELTTAKAQLGAIPIEPHAGDP